MSDIITTQDEIIATINALISAGTIDSNFSTQDNDIDKGTLPLVIVDIKTSDPSEYGNLASGDTALLDHALELIVIVPNSDHSKIMRTARNFAIDNFDIILKNISVNCGTAFHESGFYTGKRCVRVRAAITAFDNG